MPKMFLIDIKDNKKQLLDEEAALKVIDNDFDKINQITILQETTMRYDVKLQDNRRFIVESSKIESFIDEYFPLIESMVLNESEYLGERLQQDYDREYSITIPLIDEYIKLDNSTDEVGGSLSQDTKAVFELRMARWKDSVDSILECERQIKKGIKPAGFYDRNIQIHLQNIRNLKADLNKTRDLIRERIEERKQEIETKTRRHEDLRRKQGMEWRKADRMAAANTAAPKTSFNNLKDLLAARLNKSAAQPAAQPADEKAR